MKLSTRSRYGLRMMFELALCYGQGPVFLKDIASRQEISEKYLSKLVIPLRAAGLLNSGRGAHGGYSLARSPEKINALEIVNCLEGGISPVECTTNNTVCGRAALCATHKLWRRLDEAITGVLESVTLDELVKDSPGDTIRFGTLDIINKK